jgi:Flp pilus assembly protein TadB
MTTNQTVWLITWIIVLVCILIGVLVWIYTGQVFVAIIAAPPVIHWILKRRQGRDSDEY